MNKNGLKYIFVTALLIISACAQASHYAVGISANKLYIMGSTINSYSLTGSGVDLTGVAVKQGTTYDTAYISDSSGTLHVVRISNVLTGTPVYSAQQSITLDSSITSPGYVTIDDNGGVYVADKKSGNIAYIAPDSTKSVISSTKLSGIQGITSYSDGAMVIGNIGDNIYAATYAGNLSQISNSYTAAGIASGPTIGQSKYSYAISQLYYDGSDESTLNSGGLAVLNSSGAFVNSPVSFKSLTAASTALDNGIIPEAISAFEVDSSWYLGIIGYDESYNPYALKVKLDNGIPTSDIDVIALGSNAYSNYYSCATSPDGTELWFTNPQVGNVQTIDTLSWTLGSSYALNDQLVSISGFTPAATVPEPSSLLALAGFALGALGMIKKHRA